jgi:hypothetical protein
MSSILTTSGAVDGTRSLIAWAASSDSKTTIPRPASPLRVQYPATNPGACDSPGDHLLAQMTFGDLMIADHDRNDDCVHRAAFVGWPCGLYPGIDPDCGPRQGA